ncbi:membrane-associated protein, putative [Bodo saltans]|uniref:Membrane-associated protein, putative n=1 Tax=Bodo saltans TaxID=75058 RepID=A0A0S4J0X9_BODSA|nr:membrane-associated protein, putative [Bodo saltans]|eukprot:CUG76706.1 membrane-associated protein, putative [Bodo saltans]
MSGNVDTVTSVTLLLRISGTQWSLVLSVAYAAAVSSVALDIAISFNVPITSVVIHSLSIGSLIVNASIDATALTMGEVVSAAQLTSPGIVESAVQTKASSMALGAVSALYAIVTNVSSADLSLASVGVTATTVKTPSIPTTDNGGGVNNGGCNTTCVGLAAGLGGAILIIIVAGVIICVKRRRRRGARSAKKDAPPMLEYSAINAAPYPPPFGDKWKPSHDSDNDLDVFDVL